MQTSKVSISENAFSFQLGSKCFGVCRKPRNSFFCKVYSSHVCDFHCLVLLLLIWQGCFKVYFKHSEIIITSSFLMPSFLLLVSLTVSLISTVHHFQENLCNLSDKLGLRVPWMRQWVCWPKEERSFFERILGKDIRQSQWAQKEHWGAQSKPL